jgi:hypothetical protein
MQVQFGRYSDAQKSSHQLEKWSEAERLFTAGEHLLAYLAFFEYLRDPDVDNVQYSHEENRIRFELHQGSKSIEGFADGAHVEAESRVARMEKPSVPVMRKLLEVNYALSYSRFALNDDVISIKFDAPVEGGQPAKLYHALREIALNADYYDDPLIHEFSSLAPIEASRVRALEADELAVKRDYLGRWIEKGLEEAATFHPEKQSGAVSWIFLGLVYRIDFLIAPQGSMLPELRKIIGIYYAQDDRGYPEKNSLMKGAFERLLAEADNYAARDFYNVTSTFATTQNSTPDIIMNTLNDAFNGFNHWKGLENKSVSMACLEYAATYSLYTYSLPKPVRALFFFFLQVLHADYFREVGFTEGYYSSESNTFAEEEIASEIGRIVLAGQEHLSGMAFDTGKLRYVSLFEFAHSFMVEVQSMVGNFTNK